MKARLIVEGKEFDIDILDPELQKLLKPKKITGYERVEEGKLHYYDDCVRVVEDTDHHEYVDDDFYDVANYYSDKTVAENNARADKLMRQLRRFAVEHRENELDFNNYKQRKYGIQYYNYDGNGLDIVDTTECILPFSVYFDSYNTTKLAIDTFRDELIWYFTEYKDSL